jgi:hypothetical protein
MTIFSNNVLGELKQPPEAISVIAAQSRTIAILSIGLLLSGLVAILSIAALSRATARFATEARLTYVKLDPKGTWTVSEDMDANVLYYESTLRQVLYDWVERRYSERPATVLEDWGIANALYTPAMQTWFLGEHQAHAKASKIAGCVSCPPVIVKVRSHQHIDPLPDKPGETVSDSVRTLVYADKTSSASRERKIYRITWRLQTKAAIQQRPDLLRYNPIGIEILEVEETTDETPA